MDESFGGHLTQEERGAIRCELCSIYCGPNHVFSAEIKDGRTICSACSNMWWRKEKRLGRSLSFEEIVGLMCWRCGRPTQRTPRGWYCPSCQQFMPSGERKGKERNKVEKEETSNDNVHSSRTTTG